MGESGTTAASPGSSTAIDVFATANDPVTRVLGSAASSTNQPKGPQNIPRTPPSDARPLPCPIVPPTIAPEPHQRTNQIISSAFTSAQPAVASHCPMQSRSNRARTQTHKVRDDVQRVAVRASLTNVASALWTGPLRCVRQEQHS